MTQSHDPDYDELAEYFDPFYEQYVNYDQQCDFLEAAFQKYNKPVNSVMDLACGSGNHALRLARRGYQILGIDLSEPLLKIASEKAIAEKSMAQFIYGDMHELSFENRFDAVLGFNFPLAFCSEHGDIAKVLQGVARALKPGGLFVTDLDSVYSSVISDDREELQLDDVYIEDFRQWTYDQLSQVRFCEMHYYVTKDGVVTRVNGKMSIRAYYPQEALYYFEHMANFRVLEICKRWGLGEKPDAGVFVIIAEKNG
jgi:ubiquinone/menaquinone biosynthesis C-methylase UbiE